MSFPQQIDRYEVKAELGRGGMATVYHGHDPRFGRDVAIKVLPREFLHDPTFRARFEREAKAIAQMQHPHILPVYDFGEHEGQPYIVMAYMPGGSLARRIGDSPGGLPLDEIAKVVGQVAAALDEAHAAGIIHRDLKPANILFDKRGNAYLSDFGIARLSEATAQLTGSGIVGTPAYMAPEMAFEGGLSPLVDVYALGVTLYQMLTGDQPYKADTPMGVLMAHANRPVPEVREVRPDLPEAVQAVVAGAMAKDPAERYQSGGALASDLLSAVTRGAVSPRPVPEGASVEDESASPETLDARTLRAEVPTSTPTRTPAVKPAAPSSVERRRRMPGWVWVAGGVIGLIVIGGVVLLASKTLSVGVGGQTATATMPPTPIPPELAAPSNPGPTEAPPPTLADTSGLRVAVVLDTGGENDRSFNEYTLRGAHETAEELGLDFAYVVSESSSDYERNINNLISEGYNLIITVGFLMGDATAAAAVANPDVHFAIIDNSYAAGFNCPEPPGGGEVDDCYEDVLPNVTSLMFAEDQVGYLAGVLAGCMTESNVIGSVSGMEIPPVVRFVTGYQNGARSINPDVETLNVYIPDFNDSATGKQAGEDMIAQGADVIFGVGGNTGNGGLLAAYEDNLMAIGVDVDQYFTYPEVRSSLITSAAKNMDVAVAQAIRAFVTGDLEAGIQLATLANGGIGLAPYHDWEDRVSSVCREAVDRARQGIIDGVLSTGYEE